MTLEEAIIGGVFGLIGGTVGFYYVNRLLEKRREYLSTRREQLQYVFAPLEALMKMNEKEFDRYFLPSTTNEDRTFIEQHVWFPNNSEIKRIIMTYSHLLPNMPDEFLKLLTHINFWLTEYDLIYNQKVKHSPVFAGGDDRGYGYPDEVDDYVYARCAELRHRLNVS
jgi:hypothetical protein